MGLGEMWRCGCRGAGCRSPIVLAVVENLVGSWSNIVLVFVQRLGKAGRILFWHLFKTCACGASNS